MVSVCSCSENESLISFSLSSKELEVQIEEALVQKKIWYQITSEGTFVINEKDKDEVIKLSQDIEYVHLPPGESFSAVSLELENCILEGLARDGVPHKKIRRHGKNWIVFYSEELEIVEYLIECHAVVK